MANLKDMSTSGRHLLSKSGPTICAEKSNEKGITHSQRKGGS